MDDKQFDALVRRLENLERKSPEDYKTRVLLLALLGYGYIGFVLLVLLALVGLTLVIIASGHAGGLIKIVIALLAAAWFIVRSLQVKFPPPEGRQLGRAEAPELFRETDAIALAVRAPRADVVLLNDDFNASIAQIPRFGMLGFPRNYLVIGAPLLASLPKDHVRAVLAHEFAHLSHAHGKFGAWCYRIRATWFQLLQAIEREHHWSSFIFQRFFHWYVPVFSAYTSVLVRRHEHEADELAAELVGKQQMKQTLVDLEVRGSALSKYFWPDVWGEAKQRQSPPDDIYARLASTTTAMLPADFGRQAFAQALQQVTDTTDTHPSLRERIAHLDPKSPEAPAPSASFTESALSVYLGHDTQRAMNEHWRNAAAQGWTQHFEEMAKAREGLAELGAKASDSLTIEERFQLASWTEDIHGAAAALPLYEALLRDEPESAPANFNVGRLRLGAGDAGGLALLDLAMSKDANATLAVCQIAANYLESEGRGGDAVPYRERAATHHAMLVEAQHERNNITVDDEFVPSDLSEDARNALISQLDVFPAVKEALLVRKQVRHFTETPMHVFVVHVSRSMIRYGSQEKEAVQRISNSVTTPDNVHLFVLTDDHRKLLKTLRDVPGSRVYDAGTRKAERRMAQRA